MLFILSSKVGVTSFACFSASYLSKCHCPLLATCCNDVSKLNSRGSEKGNSGAELSLGDPLSPYLTQDNK